MGYAVGESFTSRTVGVPLHLELKNGERIVVWPEGEQFKVLDLPLDEAEKMYHSLELHLKLADRDVGFYATTPISATTRKALEAARGALKSQNEWHATYDEYDGYPDSALSDETHEALALVEAELK